MSNNRNEDLLKEFGAHLAKIRRSKGLSQRELAYSADIPISQISRIERGIVNPTLSTIHSIANVLESPLSELMDFSIEFL